MQSSRADNYDRAIECFAEVLDLEKTPKFFLHWLWRMSAQLGLSDAWLQAGNLANARLHADAFLRSALSTADPNVRALAWELQARIAMAEQNLRAQSKQLKRDLKFWRPLRSQWRLGDCMQRLGTSTGMLLIRTQPITISSAQHPGSCELRILFH
jgi:tetratricopeptide (TPR) repeat protein